MGTVPVLQEAGRAVSCFEEGSRAVFLQSACPERGRKPRAGPPLPLSVWWSRAHAQPARRGLVEMRPREKANGAAERKKKYGWPEEGGHFLHRPWIPPSGDKNSERPCPAPDSALPHAQPFLGASEASWTKAFEAPACPPQLCASWTHQPHWAPAGPQFLPPPCAAALSCSSLLV